MSMPDKINSWDDLASLPMTTFQCGRSSDAVNTLNGKIYEEPLLTQSNARILVGHAVNGMFRFAALPSKIYPVPMNNSDFGFGQGMFYHTDNAVYLGDCHYTLLIDGKTIDLTGAERAAETRYGLNFLPITRLCEEDLAITILSCAPVAEHGNAALRGVPLPGPAGALYSITLKNTASRHTLKGILRLNVSDKLIGDYEDLNPETWSINKADVHIRRNTLILSRPEGSAGIHLQGGKFVLNASGYTSELSYTVPPGESRTFVTYIVMGIDYNDINGELYGFMRHNPLDWVLATVNFWNGRLPRIDLSAPDAEDLPLRLHEFFIRSLLDNFNCLQTDKEGNLIAHRQGAPSHGYGTLWGIDLEPTIISTAIICPELAEKALIFTLDKTRPTSAYCKPNHSIPILCAPVVIAAYLLRQTGDIDMFTRTPEMLDSLINIMEEIILYKHNKETLFATYWSSDGLVGRRYDYGTNVKLYYAFEGLACILSALNKNGDKYKNIAKDILVSIEKTMLIDGPFGTMLSGGTNLDSDDEGLFVPDNKAPYYDGEDTSTMLAPVYGACADDYAPLVNYQRFGRSLFCENYQAETDLRTWFATAPLANDGTAILSSLGGAVSRNEMIDAAQTLIRFIDRATGSLWWWPTGWKECRKLARCSQGQGAWAWHYRSRWLGIETDALAHSLIINPRGLPVKLRLYPSPGLPFEIEYDESAGECRIKNISSHTWNIKTAFRKEGCGAGGERDWSNDTAAPGSAVVVKHKTEKTARVKIDNFSRKDIVKSELAAFSRDNVLFSRRGGLAFWLQDSKPSFDLRFVLGNGTEYDWKDVKVTLRLPEGCSASSRRQGMQELIDTNVREYGECVCHAGYIPKGERKTASFVFYMAAFHQVYYPQLDSSRHLSGIPLTDDAILTAMDITEPDLVTITAVLEAINTEEKPVKRILEFKAGYVPREAGIKPPGN
jgi:hypothetical protein